MRSSDDPSTFEHKFTEFYSTPVDSDPNARKDRRFFETNVAFSTIVIPIRIPLATFSEEVGDVFPFFANPVFADKPNHDILRRRHPPAPRLSQKAFAALHLAPRLGFRSCDAAAGAAIECAADGKMRLVPRIRRSERPGGFLLIKGVQLCSCGVRNGKCWRQRLARLCRPVFSLRQPCRHRAPA
jgi:hypothetical protein